MLNFTGRTCGPRGAIGVNRALVSPSLEILSMLVEHVDSAVGNTARYNEAENAVVLKLGRNRARR